MVPTRRRSARRHDGGGASWPIIGTALLCAAVGLGIATRPDVAHAADEPTSAEARRSSWHGGYLSRSLEPNPRFLDHGIVYAAAGGGAPSRYRLETGVGLFDHLTLGITGHWLPGEDRPRFAPRVALAFYRWRYISLGASYHWSLFPEPPIDLDPDTPSFQRRAHWYLGTVTFGQRFLSGGFDAGVVHTRKTDNTVEPESELDNPSRLFVEFGGGIFLRAGTRRWGITARALVPQVTAELMLDFRFGAFEARPRGGWWPSERVRWRDRTPARRRSR